jgi:hypothetical protein
MLCPEIFDDTVRTRKEAIFVCPWAERALCGSFETEMHIYASLIAEKVNNTPLCSRVNSLNSRSSSLTALAEAWNTPVVLARAENGSLKKLHTRTVLQIRDEMKLI